MSYYRQQLEDWLKTLEIKADVVYDIGGQQNEVRNRVKKWQVSEYKILDLPEYDLNKVWPYRQIKYADAIFCLEVFEYLIDPIQALQNIGDLLMPRSGKAYISVPLIYPVHNEVELDSLRYTENGFKRLCNAVGLKCEVAQYRKAKGNLLIDYYNVDGMHPAKGIDHNIIGYIFEVSR